MTAKNTVVQIANLNANDVSFAAGNGAQLNVRKLIEQLEGGLNGAHTVRTVTIRDSAVSGTATITLASCTAGQGVRVSGLPFIAVSGTPVVANREFKVGVSDTADALSLVAALAGNSTTAKLVTATSALGVVTLTAVPGATGNAITVEAIGVPASATITLNNTVSTKTAALGGAVRASNVVTVTSASHGFSANTIVWCVSTDANFSGGWKYLTAVATDTFTYAETGSAATSVVAITYTSSSVAHTALATTGMVLSSNVVTIITTAAHGYSTGQTVNILSADSGFTTGLKVITVDDATTFHYSQTHADIAANVLAPVVVGAYVPTVGITAVTGITWTVDDATTAAAIAAAINANTTLSDVAAPVAYATSALKVVTTYASILGTLGNTILHSVVGKGASASAARLASGAVVGTQASGTYTMSSGSGTMTMVINGVSDNVTWASSDTASAAALAAKFQLNSSALIRGVVDVTSAAGVVTVKAVRSGYQGNYITLTGTGTGATVSVAVLAGGAPPTLVVASGPRVSGGSVDSALVLTL
jgi:hypothetical protein